MRPLSPTGLARRAAPAQRVAWLLTLRSGDWTWRGATLPATLGADAYPACLAADPHWREALPDSETPGGLARAAAEVRVLGLPGAEDSLRGRLAVTPPLGLAATLRLAWLDAGAPLGEADAAILLEGRVTAWRIEPLGVRLTLLDELQSIANKAIGRLLSRAMLGADSPSLGQPLPWLFGRLEDAELLPLRAGVVSRLAAPLAAEDLTVPLVSLEGFPTWGRVQLGAELIDYTALDSARATLGTAAQPVSRPDPADHPRGTVARWVPPGGFEWLVADHACRAVESVRADGVTVDPALWAAAPRPLGEAAAHTLTLPVWPLNEDGREAARLTATVQGLADGDGSLLDNPARLLRRLLTDPRLGALPPGAVDNAAVDAAAASLAARDYRFARRLPGGHTLGALLDGAAREAGLWLLPGRPLRLLRAEPTPQPGAVQDDLAASVILGAPAPALISAPEGLVPPDALELIGPPRLQGRGRPSFRFPAESADPGLLPRRFTLDWLDLSAPAAAGDLGELLWAHLGDVPFQLDQECLPGAALLAAGDVVRVTGPPLDLDSALAWVAAVETVAPSRVRLRLRGPWAGELCWSADPLNYVRRYAFGAQLALVVGGVVAARLSRSGTLRLRGRLRENATLAAGPFTGPVAFSGGRLYLNVPAGGVFQPFLCLGPDGTADLAGAIRECSGQPLDPSGQGLGCAPGGFWLSPDAATGALEFDAATRTLHLKGIVIESIRL